MKSMKYVLVLLVLFSSLASYPVNAQSQFKDVEGHWASDAIEWAVSEGIVTGYSDNTFKPNRSVTHAEFLSMALRSQKFKILHGTNQDKWYYDYYITATANNVYSGFTSDGDKPIRRGTVAIILASIAGQHLSEQEAVQFLLDNKISNGKTSATVQGYKPSEKLTRAEAVQFLKSFSTYMKKVKSQSQSDSNDNGNAEEPSEPAQEVNNPRPVISEEQKHKDSLARIINQYNPTIRKEQAGEILGSLTGKKELDEDTAKKIGRGVIWTFHDLGNHIRMKGYTLQQAIDHQLQIYGDIPDNGTKDTGEQLYSFIQKYKNDKYYFEEGDVVGLKLHEEKVTMVDPDSIMAAIYPNAVFVYTVRYEVLEEIPFELRAGVAKLEVFQKTISYIIGYDPKYERYVYIGYRYETDDNEEDSTISKVYRFG
ncbi:S-layer homology domain-containing protein [Paenibacillus xylaniclasticus]|uniref:S-layer homology domain-containing protein n=1 Tax=Paenibacillus xylaniclasticus TaxID=588083 RepID=UPI000FDB2597|nr:MULTISPECIES: S-layer homology domain-containing protein [Paenibacillus]GFN33952.1 hypothetical protein PCURB6_42120 [Paenibacillus curdlanolyticus]